MRLTFLWCSVLCLSVVLFAGTALALDLGTNITIYDQRGYQAAGQGGEDGETEPNMINNQYWDLEGFFLNGNILSMVGGFNFVEGYSGRYSGDIFIDITGDAQFGDTANPSIINYGYEYVFDVDWDHGTYQLLDISAGPVYLSSVLDYNLPESDPLAYLGSVGDGSVNILATGTFVSGTASNSETGFEGGSHYYVDGFDMESIFTSSEFGRFFISHFTMDCGNDNLMGSNPVPEPGTMLLTGIGLIGLAAFGRRRFRRS